MEPASSSKKVKELTFNFGKIHSEYGDTSDELKGIIPLLLLTESLEPITHQIDQEIIEQLAIDLLPCCRYLWDEDLDEEILEKIKHNALLTTFVSPARFSDIEIGREAYFKLVTKFFLANHAAKDITDVIFPTVDTTTINILDSESKEMLMATELARSLAPDADGYEDDYPTLFPSLKSALPYFRSYIKEVEGTVQNYKVRIKPFKKEIQKKMKIVLTMKAEIESNEGSSLDFANRILNNRCFLELACVFENIEIPAEIRKDPLFQQFLDYYGYVPAAIECIFSIPEDLQSDRVQCSAILKLVKNGMDIQKGLDKLMELLHQNIKDTRATAKNLLQKYPDNQNVRRYIKCAENHVNGRIYLYAHTSGYSIN